MYDLYDFAVKIQANGQTYFPANKTLSDKKLGTNHKIYPEYKANKAK